MEIKLRNFKAEDCRAVLDLFYSTVLSVNAKDYSKEELDAWADGNFDFKVWIESLLSHYSLVATIDDKIVGFGDIAEDGYLDRLYVHKDYQSIGIGTLLCSALESYAGNKRITTAASITAKPFFLNRGYKVIKEQRVERKGILLTNYLTEKIEA